MPGFIPGFMPGFIPGFKSGFMPGFTPGFIPGGGQLLLVLAQPLFASLPLLILGSLASLAFLFLIVFEVVVLIVLAAGCAALHLHFWRNLTQCLKRPHVFALRAGLKYCCGLWGAGWFEARLAFTHHGIH